MWRGTSFLPEAVEWTVAASGRSGVLGVGVPWRPDGLIGCCFAPGVAAQLSGWDL